MSMQMPEIYELMDGLPPGAWVAISTDHHKVLAFGEHSEAVCAKARQLGEKGPFIGRVSDPDAPPFYSRLIDGSLGSK